MLSCSPAAIISPANVEACQVVKGCSFLYIRPPKLGRQKIGFQSFAIIMIFYPVAKNVFSDLFIATK